MRLAKVVVLLLLTGEPTSKGAGGSDPSRPPPGVQPATKKELPWLNVPGGRMRTTLFYGPWQCRREFMSQCQRECANEGYKLMGCMWLADIKLDWVGSLVALPVPVKAGGRYGISHCCCNYPTLTPTKKEEERRKWDSFRKSFRKDWSKRFGDWPNDDGVAWPGHHIRDLQHGGNPVDPNNVFPTQPSVHDIYNRAYPACYDGQPPWNTVGPDLPYRDN